MKTVRRSRIQEIQGRQRRPQPVDPTAPGRLRAEQRIGPAVVAAALAAVLSAIAWGALTLASRYGFAVVALGVGAVCGGAVQRAGHGIEGRFQTVAVVAAVLAVVLGDAWIGLLDLYTLLFAVVAGGPAHYFALRRLTEAEATALWRERMGFLDRPPQ